MAQSLSNFVSHFLGTWQPKLPYRLLNLSIKQVKAAYYPIHIHKWHTFLQKTKAPLKRALIQIQDISHWSVQSKSALRGRRTHNSFKLGFLVGLGGLEIWISSTSFQKSNIGWPQQPLTERVNNWTFDDRFHKKGPVSVILVPGMIN